MKVVPNNKRFFGWSRAEFESKKRDFSKNFEKALAEIQKNRKFPEEAIHREKSYGKKKLTQKFADLSERSNPLLYFEEYMAFYDLLLSSDFDAAYEEKTLTAHKHHLQKFQRMREYFFKPTLIEFFNEYLDMIFEHLDGSEH